MGSHVGRDETGASDVSAMVVQGSLGSCGAREQRVSDILPAVERPHPSEPVQQTVAYDSTLGHPTLLLNFRPECRLTCRTPDQQVKLLADGFLPKNRQQLPVCCAVGQ